MRYGLGIDSLPPRLDNPKFVARLVFDPLKPAGTPKTRFASIFPGKNGALIQIRLRDDLTDTRSGAPRSTTSARRSLCRSGGSARGATGSPARR